jgi:predicted dehydrogenase
MRSAIIGLMLFGVAALGAADEIATTTGRPVRLAMAGLVHGHAHGFLRGLRQRADVQLVGVFEPDADVRRAYAKDLAFADPPLFSDLLPMLEAVKPDAVATFTDTYDHPKVVQACASRHVAVMMEKPLAVSVEHARAIAKAASAAGIDIIVNYETTWYPSVAGLRQALESADTVGPIRKLVAMDGHFGPKEIGVGPEFLRWLTDPTRNGGGALYDFGCYGANLMTWMMDGERPLSVAAVTQQIKPEIYSKVDDEATIVLEYAHAQGLIQASWNWPVNRKDLEVYTTRAYAVATGRDGLRVRLPGQPEESRTVSSLPDDDADSIAYLVSVVRGARKPAGRSSLENNMVVTEILEAARTSARAHHSVRLERR